MGFSSITLCLPPPSDFIPLPHTYPQVPRMNRDRGKNSRSNIPSASLGLTLGDPSGETGPPLHTWSFFSLPRPHGMFPERAAERPLLPGDNRALTSSGSSSWSSSPLCLPAPSLLVSTPHTPGPCNHCCSQILRK